MRETTPLRQGFCTNFLGMHIADDAGLKENPQIAAKMAVTGNSFQKFLTSRTASLRQIARATRGEYSEEDLYGEAWLIASKISEKRGSPVDFSNSEDQSVVLRWLYNEVVRYTEKNVRCAVRLDRDWDLDESASAESRLAALSVPHGWPDQIGLMDSEEQQSALLEVVKYSYSQYSAYMILLNRFEWDVITLAEHLRLLACTVSQRVMASERNMNRQPSIFDRTQTINRNFVPTVARNTSRTQVHDFGWHQLGLAFA